MVDADTTVHEKSSFTCPTQMIDAQKPRYSEAGTIVYLPICKLTLHKRQHVACTETFTCYLIFCTTETLHVLKLSFFGTIETPSSGSRLRVML
jgi:hypothetical protein